jgi:hypothetical protein
VNYKFILPKAYVILLLTAALLTACQKQDAQNGNTPGPAAGLSGNVVYSEGKVTLNNRQTSTGDPVPTKSTMVTGPDSGCEIVFDHKNIIRINENTTVSLDFSQPVKVLDLQQGGIGSVLKNLEKLAGTDSFLVKTNVAVMGVRGTVIFIHADEAETYICDCNGVIYLRDKDNKNRQTVKAAHHAASVFTNENGKIVVRPGAMKYHTDADMQTLAAKIVYTIDWKIID